MNNNARYKEAQIKSTEYGEDIHQMAVILR